MITDTKILFKANVLTAILVCLYGITHGQKVSTTEVATGVASSFRGLSVVDDSIAWVGGTNGMVGISVNGGTIWKWVHVPDCDKCDFRSIFAFNEKSAVIANAGTPAHIFVTRDAGEHWQETYRLNDTAAFIDGITFLENGTGIAYGDPIEGKMLVMTTKDYGTSWKNLPPEQRPDMHKGEASFAASGTCLHMFSRRHWIIATGGTKSSLLETKSSGRNWRRINTPMLQGKSSTGIFSLHAANKKSWLIVGGDYKDDSATKDNAFFTKNSGRLWIRPFAPPRGYRECISSTPAKNNRVLLTLGPGGIDISYDNGNTWQALTDDRKLHVIKKARNGHLTIAAGGSGKIMIFR